MDKKTQAIADCCALGAQGDQLLAERKFDDAESKYNAVIDGLEKSGYVDGRVLGKAVLGIMCSKVMREEFVDAHALWIKGDIEQDKSMPSLGIYMLERGQTDAHDSTLYMMLCARLHSLSNGDPGEAAKAVDHCMKLVCERAREEEPDLLPMALTNWALCMSEVYNNAPPDEALKEFEAALQFHPLDLEKSQFEFPKPSPWDYQNWGDTKVIGPGFSLLGWLKNIIAAIKDWFQSLFGKKQT